MVTNGTKPTSFKNVIHHLVHNFGHHSDVGDPLRLFDKFLDSRCLMKSHSLLDFGCQRSWGFLGCTSYGRFWLILRSYRIGRFMGRFWRLKTSVGFYRASKILVLVMQYMTARWRIVLSNKILTRAKRANFVDYNFVKSETLKMWILWKMIFWKCEFLEKKWDFKKVNFVKNEISEM